MLRKGVKFTDLHMKIRKYEQMFILVKAENPEGLVKVSHPIGNCKRSGRGCVAGLRDAGSPGICPAWL
jgi:hypothetical protein